MKTETGVKSQEAINDFFEAYGTDTAKEYSESLFDLLLIVSEKKDLSIERRDDLTTKLKDLNRLVLQLRKTDVVKLGTEIVHQRN